VIDWVDQEVMRSVPRELSEAQLAARGRRMQNLNQRRTAVQSVAQPGTSFQWPNCGDRDAYAGATATIDRFKDEWCWVRFVWPDGRTLTKNLGFKRVYEALKAIGKID